MPAMALHAEIPDTRLAVYGTLAPGQENHGQLEGLAGRWLRGAVRGRLGVIGWDDALGYPALTLDPDGPELTVQIFESADLPANWPRLDAFEGECYRRVATEVATADGAVMAYIYEAAPPGRIEI